MFILRPNNQVSILLFLCSKALIELYSVQDAIEVMEYFNKNKLIIYGHEIVLQYSRHSELIIPEDHYIPQRVLLISIVCLDNSTLSLNHLFSVFPSFSLSLDL